MNKNLKMTYFSKIFFLCFLIGAMLVSFFGCKSVKDERLYPREQWEFSIEQDETKIADSDFSHLDSVSNLHTLLENRRGFVWVRYVFTLPDSLKGKDLSLFLGRLNMADKTYFNGELIGNAGIMPPEGEFSAWNETRVYHIPQGLIDEEGENVLFIKIFVDGEGEIPAVTFIGTTNDAQNYGKSDKFWNSTLILMCAFALIVVGIYHLILFGKRTKEKENLMFAILNFIVVLYYSVWYIQDVFIYNVLPLPFLTFQKIFSDFMPFVLASFLIEFINAFLKRKEHWILRTIRYVLVLLPTVLIFIQPNYLALKNMRNLIHIFLFAQVGYVIYIIIKSIVVKREGAISILIGFIPFVLCTLFDLIPHSVFGVANFPFLSTYSWMLVIMSFLFILAGKFAQARNDADYLNKNLEKEVADRTKDLSESNAQLAMANDRAEKDMKLAVNVQRNFYPKAVPQVEGWDIAYTFQPMAGVSGDLFNFFYKDDVLEGACLFDVSGHGIGSGLVTMLSKTVIDREFEKGKSIPIGRVMHNINDSISNDKGDIENYLTGIIVRIEGNRIDYVNGGHPALLCRSGKTGQAVQATLVSGDSGGSLIGIPLLPAEYKGISFNVKSGDSIMIYTDCLYESRNKAGDEFGAENVQKIFAECGNGSAQSQLDNVLAKFHEYTEGVPLNDDLTVLVLKKL